MPHSSDFQNWLGVANLSVEVQSAYSIAPIDYVVYVLLQNFNTGNFGIR